MTLNYTQIFDETLKSKFKELWATPSFVCYWTRR
jgi:hypothetical protein